MSYLIPMVIEQTNRGERSYDIYKIRVTFTPYKVLNFSIPNFSPFNSRLVTIIFLEIRLESMAFQSIPSLFQSIAPCLPNNAERASTSFFSVTIKSLSFFSIRVSEVDTH